MRRTGFTLIELMVVIVILGVVIALILPSLSGLKDDRDMQREARRLAALLEFASDEAVMQGRDFGVRFGRDSYAFFDFDPDTGAWLELTGDDLLRRRSLPEDGDFELWLEERQILLDAEPVPAPTRSASESDDQDKGDKEEDDEVKVGPPPHVAILSSGETTPFLLRLQRDFDIDDVELRVSELGEVSIITGAEP